MYCKECGTEIEDGKKYCPNCGKAVNYLNEGVVSKNSNEEKQNDVMLWILCFSPIIIGILMIFVGFYAGGGLLGLFAADMFMLRQKGIKGKWQIIGIFIPPVYMYYRSVKVEGTTKWFIIYIAVAIAEIIIPVI